MSNNPYDVAEIASQLRTLQSELRNDLSQSTTRGTYIAISQRIERTQLMLDLCAKLEEDPEPWE